ncbi:hypothetical protein GCM10007897_12670 [Sphingobium jiangsuense]|uniref:17 kDa surface antigen n=1 Tax=Sphingobium jiangsuense TaxID=870476 RepID=A0A7W6BMU9_9SPHN|nr:glycine zipper 2TM domain-containing protein [Sphingobium jiangsuense]MBB3925523.1 Ni/Co efflux regulator RcnB [Sphingobium jiangsuense]GLS99884.1 hypothetical protein GCM10007897_12670 [Sphingobium jiangsuense]
MKGTYRTVSALLMAASLGLGTVAATPAQAQPQRSAHDNDRGRHDDRRGDRDRHDARRDTHRTPAHRQSRRPVIIHNYDYNRPDPRYRGYYANHYYRSGYQPIRVTRQTRIYRGADDRYYCRRSDGTTGLIVGAALGGIIGNRLDRGQSSIMGTLLGAGAGALLGREIDRGGVSCR